jgi:MATE family multidrug resistance protein
MKNIFSIKNDLYPLLALAIPLALTGLARSSIFFFETLFLAHVSQEVLAAGALVSWFFSTIAVILYGILRSINILVAHKVGAKNHPEISVIARDGLLLAILLAVPAAILFWNMSPLFLLFGQSSSVVLLAKSYLHALAWGLPANLIMIACLEVIMGLGHARVILAFSIFTVSLSILFSYLLIFGKFGLPILGVAGAGWGMTISYWITFIFLIIYILSKKIYRDYFKNIFNLNKPKYLSELFQVGTPMGAMFSVEVAFFFVLTLLMGSLGSQIQAANQIALQYLGTLMAIIFSIAHAITVRMGHLLGAKEIHRAEKTSYAGIFIAATLMCVVAIVYWFFPTMLISLDFDVHNPKNFEIVRYVEQILMVSAIFQIFEATRIVLFGALRGLKDTRFTLLTSIIGFWCIALPIGYLLATRLHFGGIAYWWGMVISAVFTIILLQQRLKQKINGHFVSTINAHPHAEKMYHSDFQKTGDL